MLSGVMLGIVPYQLPTILFNLVCIICGIAFYKRNPTVAWLIIIGMLISLLGRIFFIAMYAWVMSELEHREWIQWIGLVSMACSFIAYALMIVAVFVGRGKPPSEQAL